VFAVPLPPHSSEIRNQLNLPSGTTRVRLDTADFSIPLAQIGRYAGGSRYEMGERSQAMARDALAWARKLARPIFGYALFAAVPEASGSAVGLPSGHRLALPAEERDPGIQGVAAVACTLGHGLDQKISALGADGDLAQSLFVDAAGVALLEALGAACRAHILTVLKPLKLFCGCPFGPGYGTTPMGSLGEIFDHLDGEALGVDLRAETMMRPLKSVAFWLRLTANPKALKSPAYKCRRCSMENCIYRAAG
jgi:hypothetical protein